MENIDENKNMENGKKVEGMKAELEWKDENIKRGEFILKG